MHQLQSGLSSLNLSNAATIPVAYHVSNVEEKQPQPNWKQLACTPADDKDYDGALLGLPVVFLTTTLYKKDLPDRSTYPRYQGCKGKSHWRLSVPLNQFIRHSMWLMAKGDTQVHILLVDPASPWHRFLSHYTKGANLIKKIEPLLDNNPYLSRVQNQFVPNDYDSSRIFVNIELLEALNISNGKWGDTVPCTQDKPQSSRILPAPSSTDMKHNRLVWLYECLGRNLTNFITNNHQKPTM